MIEDQCSVCGNHTACEVDPKLDLPICPICIANLKKEAAKPAWLEEHGLGHTLPTATREVQIGGNHYKQHPIQPWDIIEEYNLDFFLGNAIKYILRHPDKGGLEDLKKAQHYLSHKIYLMESSNA